MLILLIYLSAMIIGVLYLLGYFVYHYSSTSHNPRHNQIKSDMIQTAVVYFTCLHYNVYVLHV